MIIRMVFRELVFACFSLVSLSKLKLYVYLLMVIIAAIHAHDKP